VKTVALVFALVSGGCLTAIMVRARLPLVGGIASKQARVDMDSTSKRLALISLFSFLLAAAFFGVAVTR